MTNRNVTIDIAKGIGIIFVVLGHNNLVAKGGELYRVIFSFHMPLFFFLSGILIKESASFNQFFLSRATALLKPYFVVLTAFGVLKLALSLGKNDIAERASQYFIGLAWGGGSTIAAIALWYLPHLFVSSSFALVVIKLFNCTVHYKKWLIFLACLLLVIGINSIETFWQPNNAINQAAIGSHNLPGLPWSIDLIPITSAFILLGYLLRDSLKIMTAMPSLGFWGALAFFSLHYYFNDSMNLSHRLYGNPWVTTLQAVLGIYLTLCLAMLLEKITVARRLLTYLGQGTLFILIFHGFIQGNMIEQLAQFSDYSSLNCVVSTMAGVFLPLLFWEIAKRQKLVCWLLLPRDTFIATMPQAVSSTQAVLVAIKD